MVSLEQLTLSGAVTLLTYLQHARLDNETDGMTALAATLCELLNQLESVHPGIARDFGWQRVLNSGGVIDHASADYLFLEPDRAFQSSQH